MASYQEKRCLPFTAEELYLLIKDIKSYPDFLPWCLSSTLLDQNAEEIIATLTIGSGLFKESFTSKVTLFPNQRIEMVSNNGPLTYLKSAWHFTPHPQGSEVEFIIDFELKSSLFQRLLKSLLKEVSSKMISAFEKRAHTLYQPKIRKAI